jgi:hypothetical protein
MKQQKGVINMCTTIIDHPSTGEYFGRAADTDMIAEQSKCNDRDEEIVLRFLSEGRIIQLPKKAAHRRLVLNYLVSKFEIGTEYTEGQVNVLIDEWHTFGDYFVLRRELIDSGMLKRLPNGSKYWREIES